MANRLTDQQAKFVERVADGAAPAIAARDVGYAHAHQQASRLMRHPNILSALRGRRQAAIEGNMANVALRTMSELMTDDTVPAATRYKASEWTLRAAGLGADPAARGDGERKELEDMNADELAQAVQSGMAALSELARGLEGRHYVDGELREVQRVEVLPGDDQADEKQAEPAADWMD